MSFFQRYKNIGLFGILAVMLIVAYFSFFRSGNDASGPDLLTIEVESASNQTQSELLSLLVRLKTLRLDATLFTDPRFTNLTDFSVPLQPQAAGRPNPFLPLGADAPRGESATTSLPASKIPGASSGTGTTTAPREGAATGTSTGHTP